MWFVKWYTGHSRVNLCQQVTGWPSIISSQQFASAVWWSTYTTVVSRARAFSEHLGFLCHRDPKLQHIHFRLYHFIEKSLNLVKKEKKTMKSTCCTCIWFTRYADLWVKLDEILKEIEKKITSWRLLLFKKNFLIFSFFWRDVRYPPTR